MQSWIVAAHVAFGGLWLGCVLTEGLFERALLNQGAAAALIVARLHRRVDVVVEVPAMAGVAVTGALLLQTARLNAQVLAMTGLGVLAILANLVCVVLVFRRVQAAEAGDAPRFERLDRLQHRVGGVVLIALLCALGAGMVITASAR